jgi:hypothetical protein
MARNKQYNEQVMKDVFILAQWVSKYLGTYVGKDVNQFLFMQVLETNMAFS